MVVKRHCLPLYFFPPRVCFVGLMLGVVGEFPVCIIINRIAKGIFFPHSLLDYFLVRLLGMELSVKGYD